MSQKIAFVLEEEFVRADSAAEERHNSAVTVDSVKVRRRLKSILFFMGCLVDETRGNRSDISAELNFNLIGTLDHNKPMCS